MNLDLSNYEDYLEAKAIILKSLKSRVGKLLSEYPRWDNLDYAARVKAIEDTTCPLCYRMRPLTGTYKHMFGTESVCEQCSDQVQYAGRMII